MKITAPKTAEWFGARCTTWTVQTGGPNSERVGVYRWIDQADERNGSHPAGTVVLRHMKGDGRSANFTLFDQVVVADAADLTDAEVTARATALIEARV